MQGLKRGHDDVGVDGGPMFKRQVRPDGPRLDGADGAAPQEERRGPPKSCVLRLLIQSNQVGPIIGKGGNTVKQIRQNSGGARIRIIDVIPTCDERVLVFSCKDDPEAEFCPSQLAVVDVHERLADAAARAAETGAAPAPSQLTVRLLVCRTQAGSVIGKGGSIIKKIREESHAHVKVMSEHDVPPCGLSNDNIVQIGGTREAVTSCIKLVTSQLRKNPPKERPGGPPASLNLMNLCGDNGGVPPAALMAGMNAPPPDMAPRPGHGMGGGPGPNSYPPHMGGGGGPRMRDGPPMMGGDMPGPYY